MTDSLSPGKPRAGFPHLAVPVLFMLAVWVRQSCGQENAYDGDVKIQNILWLCIFNPLESVSKIRNMKLATKGQEESPTTGQLQFFLNCCGVTPNDVGSTRVRVQTSQMEGMCSTTPATPQPGLQELAYTSDNDSRKQEKIHAFRKTVIPSTSDNPLLDSRLKFNCRLWYQRQRESQLQNWTRFRLCNQIISLCVNIVHYSTTEQQQQQQKD